MKLQFANRIFNNGDLASSARYYHVVIDIAMQLFLEFKSTTPLPRTLTPTLVVSYLNLSDCWEAQSKKKEQILCLIEIYDFLKNTLADHSTSYALNQQVYEGISKIYLELCFCFKKINALYELEQTEKDFAELPMFYQLQSDSVH